ncbi:MAG: class I SAM-dependent methyltransferase [Candidatus Saccharicenans sp.]
MKSYSKTSPATTIRNYLLRARRGYAVMGADLSESMLKRAREKAEENKVRVNFIQADTHNLPFEREFDVAIMLCEGGFPLMEADEMNFEILKHVTRDIRPGGKFIFTTLNALFPLFHSVKEFKGATEAGSLGLGQNNTFDLMTF